MEKKLFEKPMFEITYLDADDVIGTSGLGDEDKAGYTEEDFEKLFNN